MAPLVQLVSHPRTAKQRQPWASFGRVPAQQQRACFVVIVRTWEPIGALTQQHREPPDDVSSRRWGQQDAPNHNKKGAWRERNFLGFGHVLGLWGGP